MRYFLLVLFVGLIFTSCSKESDTMTENSGDNQEEQSGDPTDDGDDDNNGGNDDLRIPQIAISGEDFDDNLSLFLVEWDEDYNNRTTRDLVAETQFINPSIFDTHKNGFYISENGTSTPDIFKFDLSVSQPTKFLFEDYFMPSKPASNAVEWASEDYIVVYFIDAVDPLNKSFYYSYNVLTGVSHEFALENFDWFSTGGQPMIANNYSFIMLQEDGTDQVFLNVFDLISGERSSIPFDNYRNVFYNDEANQLLLFLENDACSIDYDVFDLQSFTISNSSSLSQNFCFQRFLAPSDFYSSKMLHFRNTAQSGPLPNIYDFNTGENQEIDVASLLFQLDEIVNLQVFTVNSAKIDLETNTIVTGFSYVENNVRKGGVAFLTLDKVLKKLILTDEVQPFTIIFK